MSSDRLIASVVLEIALRQLDRARHEALACEQELQSALIRAENAKRVIHKLSDAVEKALVSAAALHDYGGAHAITKVSSVEID